MVLILMQLHLLNIKVVLMTKPLTWCLLGYLHQQVLHCCRCSSSCSCRGTRGCSMASKCCGSWQTRCGGALLLEVRQLPGANPAHTPLPDQELLLCTAIAIIVTPGW